MTDMIAHRGPDGEGHWIEGGTAVGHRRLSIIDLSAAGHQPMQSPDGRYVLSYNGEVYNFRELRAELEAAGHQFHSRTDSEVVLLALAHWGKQAFDRLNGMFAFALWDRKERKLLLARDRYGIKPLYYAQVGETLLFGSEVKSFLVHPQFRAEMDCEALLEYMTFQNFFTDRTLFKGARTLPAGSWMEASAERGIGEPQRYWDYSFQEPIEPGNEDELVERLDYLFQQAVTRQLVSDVEVGAYLSGGMDSGSITAVAGRQLPFLRSFTVGFDMSSASSLEFGYDEREKAEQMSYLFKTEHYEMVLKAGDMERCMGDLVWHLEEPRAGQSYPNFYAAKLAGKFCKVVLAGTGGDELFGGYPWRYYRAVVNDDFEHYVDKYYRFWQRLIPNKLIRDVFRPIAGDVAGVWTRDIFRDVFTQHARNLTQPEEYVNHSLYFEAKTFLHGLLIVEDKLSMAHSLESRVPFLDNDLVDFAMGVSVHHKLRNLTEVMRLNENELGSKAEKYFRRTRDGKNLLRKAMGYYIPREIAEREKQGFSGPDASWFRDESIDYVRRTLLEGQPQIYGYFDGGTIRDLVNEHIEGRENRRLLIWSLLSLEEWCRTFLMTPVRRPACVS